MRIAYLTGRYPGISHTFVTREVHALRARGVMVDTYSIWPTRAEELLTAGDAAEAAATVNLLPPRGRAAMAHLRALGRSPAGYGATLVRAVRLAAPGVRGRLVGVSWFLEAIVLWACMDRRGTTHVHVHLNGTAPSVALLTTSFARSAGKPWTWSLTVHGPAEFYDVVRERLATKIRDAAFAVAISDFARSQLLGLVDPGADVDVHVVHCGVDPSVFDAPSREDPVGDRPLRVLTVARLTPVKGHAVLLEAVAALAEDAIDVRLDLVGDGPARPSLERLAQELGIGDRVTFAGAVGQDRIREHFRQADVFALTSFAEGVPVVLMEAMAMRLPVVASAVMGVPELIEDGRSGLLVRPARADLVASALRRLHAGPDERRAMGAAGRERVVREFDTRESAAALERLFQRYSESCDAPAA